MSSFQTFRNSISISSTTHRSPVLDLCDHAFVNVLQVKVEGRLLPLDLGLAGLVCYRI